MVGDPIQPFEGGGSLSRREFLRTASVAAAGVFAGGMRAGGIRTLHRQEEVLRIALVLPEGASGDSARRGVQLGLEEAERTAQLFGRRLELVSAAAGSDAGQAAAALVRQGRPFALVGGTDTASALALGDIADRERILFFNIGAPAEALRAADCRRYTFHITPSSAMLTDALADWLAGPGHARRWFFVHPPTAEGHAAWGRARAALGIRGGKQAGSADVGAGHGDFRLVLKDVARAGADAIFSALTGAQQMAFVAEYRQAAPSIPFAGLYLDEAALRAAALDRRAGIWPALWYHERKPFGAGSLSARFKDRFGQEMDGAAWAGWLALKLLWEGSARARSTDPTEVGRHLVSEHAEFDGHKGVPLSFRPWDRQLRQPVYLLRPRPEPPSPDDIFDVVMELPRSGPGQTGGTVALLDHLGNGPDNSECRVSIEAASPSR